MKKATHKQTKQHNRDLILRTIFKHELISRAEIARTTHLTRTTVSDLVGDMLNEGLVQEVGLGTSLGGKMPILLSVVPDARYIIGLNLMKGKFIGAIVNLRGELKETVEVALNGDNGEQALQLIYQIIDELIAKQMEPLIGIGVGTPGLINTREGVVVTAVNLEWQDLPLGQLLHERYKLPVSILNDSQATAIGEFVYGGEYLPDQNLIVVNVRHGIGAGLLLNGRLFQGDGGGAGEIGHVIVQEQGELCQCGKRGCLETISSARAILARTGLSTIAEVRAAFEAHDPLVTSVVESAARYLGISIANLIGTLNIQKIVLAGDAIELGPSWLTMINQSMRNAALSSLVEGTQLMFGKLDYRACILGAAAILLLDNYTILYSKEY